MTRAMEKKFLLQCFKKYFYTFLDVSGIALGFYLLALGFWLAVKKSASRTIYGVLLGSAGPWHPPEPLFLLGMVQSSLWRWEQLLLDKKIKAANMDTVSKKRS